MAVQFFDEDSGFNLKNKNLHKKWLKTIAEQEGYKVGELTYIFCSDEYLYKINVEYLNHDTYTDIITFDNSEEADMIEGDIFISIDRVKENSARENNGFQTELQRVMSHGILHLLGYKDKTKKDKKIMREMEDKSISLFDKI
ncbi:rRNA maturation RNase YbeY [Belliella marina]|uniref:Endoribonuclease YbeY n=1 Tax=Belliella marina TaxID=1644146 RepID=A0ABW4VNY6_9BACT